MHKYLKISALVAFLSVSIRCVASTEQASSCGRNMLALQFGMPSVASNTNLEVELDVGKLESLKCGGLHFKTIHSSHGKNLDSFALLAESKNRNSCVWAVICISTTYNDAANWLCNMLSRQSSMPLEMRIADMERIDGIGDFCIADKGANRKLTIFIHGNLAACLRIEGKGKTDIISLAREIDTFLQKWSYKKESANLKPTEPQNNEVSAAPRSSAPNALYEIAQPNINARIPQK